MRNKLGMFLIWIAMGTLLAGCLPARFVPNGTCTTSKTGTVTTITCPDGTSSTIDDGTDGQGCTASPLAATGLVGDPCQYGATLITCANGSALILNGATGATGSTGATGAQGAQGQQGEAGQNGANGSNGTNGTNGVNGTNGSNGTVVTPIQFCPNVKPDYPTTFPEVGFCINNTLYAVYSANGGFLTEVTPGEWESNAIGSACSFTVGPNCEVTGN